MASIDDLRLAPFHLLASVGAVHGDKDHLWHMRTLAKMCREEPLLHTTSHTIVETTDTDSEAAAVAW